MAIEGKTLNNVVAGRRTREAYITTLQGQPGQLTLYRDNTISVEGQMLAATRDDTPIQKTDAEIAAMTFSYKHGGQTKEIGGVELLTAIAAAFDQLDPKTPGEIAAAAEQPQPGEA